MHRTNPFPKPSPLEQVLLRELVAVAKRCYDRGWSHGTAGNFSLRGTNGIVWQSPSGLSKDDLNPDHFVAIDIDSVEAVGPQAARASDEMPVHLGIFRAVASAKTVVHTHPPNLVTASRSGENLVFQGEEMAKRLGVSDHLAKVELPVIANVTPKDMPAMATDTKKHINPDVPLVTLAAHGVYAWGNSPLEALSFIEAAEFLCLTNR